MVRVDDLVLDIKGGAEAPKSKSRLVILIVVVVSLLGVSATATLMLTGVLYGGDEAVAEQVSAGAKVSGNKVAATRAPLNYIPLDPPFVVNFNADSDVRYLQISVEAGTRDPEAVDQVKEQRPAIRNSLVMLFSSQDPEVLNTREGKEKLRADALAEIRKVMKAEIGKASVDSVFFTGFVMQ